MTNKRLEDHEEIMREIGVLIDRAMLQIVNAMRHIELNTAGHEAIRRVDQLTRALEYLCDVEEYNKKIEGKLRGMVRSNQKHKQRIRELQQPTDPKLAEYSMGNIYHISSESFPEDFFTVNWSFSDSLERSVINGNII